MTVRGSGNVHAEAPSEVTFISDFEFGIELGNYVSFEGFVSRTKEKIVDVDRDNGEGRGGVDVIEETRISNALGEAHDQEVSREDLPPTHGTLLETIEGTEEFVDRARWDVDTGRRFHVDGSIELSLGKGFGGVKMRLVEAIVGTEGEEETNGGVADDRGENGTVINPRKLGKATNTEASTIASDGTSVVAFFLEDPF